MLTQVVEGGAGTVLTLLQLPDPSTVVFRTRVGVTALDLANIHGAPQLSQLRAALIATAYSDTYAARDALAHPLLRPAMTAGQHRDLAELAHASGLDSGTIPEPLYGDLLAAVSSAENQLRVLLDRDVAGPSLRTATAERPGGVTHPMRFSGAVGRTSGFMVLYRAGAGCSSGREVGG
ncbi:MAG: hypothetical protein ACRDTC_17640 [Pseudonocardiaceae bacterium]